MSPLPQDTVLQEVLEESVVLLVLLAHLAVKPEPHDLAGVKGNLARRCLTE